MPLAALALHLPVQLHPLVHRHRHWIPLGMRMRLLILRVHPLLMQSFAGLVALVVALQVLLRACVVQMLDTDLHSLPCHAPERRGDLLASEPMPELCEILLDCLPVQRAERREASCGPMISSCQRPACTAMAPYRRCMMPLHRLRGITRSMVFEWLRAGGTLQEVMQEEKAEFSEVIHILDH